MNKECFFGSRTYDSNDRTILVDPPIFYNQKDYEERNASKYLDKVIKYLNVNNIDYSLVMITYEHNNRVYYIKDLMESLNNVKERNNND